MSAARSETTDRLLTGDDLLAMGDIGPCELVDGRIVPMSPTGGEHGEIEVRLASALAETELLRGEGVLEGFELPVAEAFAE
jgi:Uma2 family endonuclease